MQTLARPDVALIRKLAQLLMERVARFEKAAVWEELSIVLMDDAGISLLNQRYLGVSESTDVLSFRYEVVPGRVEMACGEVVVNVECAMAEGARRKGASAELALYLAHGCDHLSGANDSTPRERKRMRARETRWLRELAGVIDIFLLLKCDSQ